MEKIKYFFGCITWFKFEPFPYVLIDVINYEYRFTNRSFFHFSIDAAAVAFDLFWINIYRGEFEKAKIN